MDADRLDYYERLLRMKPVIERLFAIAESKIKQSIESGNDSTFFKLTNGRRSRDWNTDADTLSAVLGDKVFGPPQLLTVAAAEKVFGKDDVKQFVKTLEGGSQLKPRSDIKAEISVNASEFK